MKSLFKKFVSVAICAISTFSCGLTSHAFANKCDFNLLEKVAQTDKNALVSPLSLKFAMMMAANGAEGETKKEILNAFEIENLDDFSEKISQEFYNCNDLKIANSIWQKSNSGAAFSKEYKNKIKKYFEADTGEFKTVNVINSWIKNKTKGKIKDLLPKELDKDEKFVAALVNAIYFKADWLVPFSAENTRKDDFHNADNTCKSVDFMNKTSNFNYFGNGNFQLLEMKYKNSDLSMYVILPKNGYKVTHEDFENALENKKSTLVNVHLPKFKFESDTFSLKNPLNNMGICKAFREDCKDFDAMFDARSKMFYRNFYISDVLQKAFVEVDEKGTEAAAAAAVIFHGANGCIATPKPLPVYFNADHPFTYIIRNNKSGEIAFMGQQCEF